MSFVLVIAPDGSIGYQSLLFVSYSALFLFVGQDLLGWLRTQKERGYTIVGLEQTSSSIPLSDLSFPERTVLLLGKEKEGIPVQFLQVVDVCVEIPQLGVIRSLNVHVTGAVAIWEYTKQMMNRSTSS
jgi:tRNA G18 (ribose-2'-O)-methylase SpoU